MTEIEKTTTMSLRVPPEVKEAAERAAREDARTVSNYVLLLLAEHLRGAGYLKGGPRRKTSGRHR